MARTVDVYFLMLAYMGCHATAYFLVLRRFPIFGSERAIFLYHAVSIAVCFAAFLAIPGKNVWTENPVVGPILLHAVYSLSFLELWALADDSYSIAILNRIHQTGPIKDLQTLADLRQIGERKQRGRLKTLLRWRLVRFEDGRVALTGVGRLVATVCLTVLWIVNVKHHG